MYKTIQDAKWTCRIYAEAQPDLVAALLDDTAGTPIVLGGRGALRGVQLESIPTPFAGAKDLVHPPQMIIRKYRRGGALRHLRRDAFLLDNRPLREFEVHEKLQAAGIPVAPLLGVAWRQPVPGFYEGRIATLQLTAVSLHQQLRELSGASWLPECAKLVRQVHDLGVSHPDLQVENFLVGARAYLIDFDKASVSRKLGPSARARNLLRFRRSLEKQGHPLEYFDLFMQGYGAATLPAWLQRVYRAKGRLSDLLSGRTIVRG